MKKSWCFRLVLSTALLLAIPASAQAVATADLSVTVRDPHGALVPNARVIARSSAFNLERAITGSSDGQYAFLSLAPGNYTLVAEAEGFARFVAEDVRLNVGQIARVNLTLQLKTVAEAVTATVAPDLIETQRTSATTTVDSVRIEALPINGRNYFQHALTDSRLLRDASPVVGAAPTSGLNFGGQRARANLVNVDGADAVENTTNGIRSTISQEAVEEFQVQNSSFAAEYGRSAGGVVNVITKAGGDEFHGSSFAYLRNRRLQAVDRFSTAAEPAYTRLQAGLSAGGPLKKNRTHYFLALESTRRHEAGFSNIGVDNFGLSSFDTEPLAPFLGLNGASFGTVLLTSEQIQFLSALDSTLQALPAAQKTAVTPLVQKFLAPYLTLTGGGAGIALHGNLPSAAMAPVVAYLASRNRLPAPVGLKIFPSSGAVLPPSFVPLYSLRGDYPVKESTDQSSFRFDHRLANAQTGTLRVGYTASRLTGIQNTYAAANYGQSAWSRSTEQTFHDWTVTARHMWVLDANRINELRFQYAYRGLSYDYSRGLGGDGPGVNIAGFAFFGREPISYVKRKEQRFQVTDNYTRARGMHTFKTGIDLNVLPMSGMYTIQFGGLYAFGGLRAGALLSDDTGSPLDQLDLSAVGSGKIPVAGLSPVQAYGIGVPQSFTQGIGNPYEQFTNKAFAGYVQDSWRMRPNLTLNYGLRYDVELTPTFRAENAASQAAEAAMGVTQGIPRDLNNLAPRIGIAWDPSADGKTVLRASYGVFYDHPLMALAFTSDVADGAQAPLLALAGGAPGCAPSNRNVLNATNAFQGLLSCLPSSFNYLAGEQRFNPVPNAPSVFTGQQYLASGTPLIVQPLTMPVARDFQYAYADQVNLTVERELGRDVSLELGYNFTVGRHLIRPLDRNAPRGELLKLNYDRTLSAVNALAAAGVPASVVNTLRPSDPLSAGICPSMLQALGLPPVWGTSNFTPAPLVSFFRPSGLNPSLLLPASPFAICTGSATTALQEWGLGVGVPVPFSSIPANYSDGSSVYHGLTANLRRRMSAHAELRASYTWSHTIDDGSIELQTGLGPQDAHHPERERANSLFDQRHRFVLSGVFSTGRRFRHGWATILNDWTFAPVIEVSSGRPFNIVTYTDRNLDLVAVNDRPMVVAPGAAPNACADPAIASTFSPTGFFQLPCYKDLVPTYSGNLGRNAGVKPWVAFTDVRLSRTIALTDRLTLNGTVDIFNAINRFNVADVNPLYTAAGAPTSAFDPRQIQLAARLRW